MFFAGRLPKPPWETRSRVEALVKQYDRAYIQNYGDRFRSARCSRGTRRSSTSGIAACGRARKGRAGPFRARSRGRRSRTGAEAAARIAWCTSRRSAIRCSEIDKLHDLYDSLVEARREVGEEAVPFDKFADLVKSQVQEAAGRAAARRSRFAWRSRTGR